MKKISKDSWTNIFSYLPQNDISSFERISKDSKKLLDSCNNFLRFIKITRMNDVFSNIKSQYKSLRVIYIKDVKHCYIPSVILNNVHTLIIERSKLTNDVWYKIPNVKRVICANSYVDYNGIEGCKKLEAIHIDENCSGIFPTYTFSRFPKTLKYVNIDINLDGHYSHIDLDLECLSAKNRISCRDGNLSYLKIGYREYKGGMTECMLFKLFYGVSPCRIYNYDPDYCPELRWVSFFNLRAYP